MINRSINMALVGAAIFLVSAASASAQDISRHRDKVRRCALPVAKRCRASAPA